MFPFRKSELRDDVDAELAFHVEMRIRDLVARGVSEAAAREEAERRFGERAAVRDACIAIDTRRRERVRRKEFMSQLLQDLRFALRTLFKSPAFTAMAVLCVGLGVGVTSTILSAVNAILVRPLPYPRAQELAAVYAWAPKTGEHRVNISYPDYLSWKSDSRSFAQLGMWTWQALNFSGEASPSGSTAPRSPPISSRCSACARCSAAISIPPRNDPTAPAWCCWATGSGSGASEGTAPSSARRSPCRGTRPR
jgi:hypothetical protein